MDTPNTPVPVRPENLGACNCPPGPSNRPCCLFPQNRENVSVDLVEPAEDMAKKAAKKKRSSDNSKDHNYRPNSLIEIPEGMYNENPAPQENFYVRLGRLVSSTFLFFF